MVRCILLDLSPFLRQTVKTQNSGNGSKTPSNGGWSHGFVSTEFKLAAVRRLEMGASIAEVARAFEVNPNVLHR